MDCKYLIFTNCIFIFCISQGIALSDEARLTKYLLENVSKTGVYGRPVYNTSETLRINTGMALIQITEVDVNNNFLEVSTWLRFLWKDINMQWDPEDFGGVDHVRLPNDKIWRPDYILYNSLGDYLLNAEQTLAVVSSDGTVLFIPSMRLKATCSMDLLYFPADVQTCQFKFGSWTYDGFKLDIDFYDGLEEIDMSDYIHHSTWKVVAHSARKNVKYYPCCAEPYPDITFTLKLKRMSSYLNIWLVRPFIVVALLLPFVFCVHGYTKILAALGMLIATSVLLLMVQDDIPLNGIGVPHLVFGYSGLYTMAALSVALTILTSNLAKKGKHGNLMPSIIKQIFIDQLGKVVCVSPGPYPMAFKSPSITDQEGENALTPTNGRPGMPMDRDTKMDDWQLLARVLDRIILMVYILIMLIFCLVGLVYYEIDQ